MDIERINDHTIKFFVPFQDVEIRGFSKEEVLFQPERGEELFWDIMDELNRMKEVKLESPLWIQVHVTDLGLEVMAIGIRDLNEEEFEGLTAGYLDGALFEQFEKMLGNMRIDGKISMDTFHKMSDWQENSELSRVEEIEVFSCATFEDIIQLSAYEQHLPAIEGIYELESRYYLGINLHAVEKEAYKNMSSLLLEFTEISQMGWMRIQTYGKCMGQSDGLIKIRQAFFG